MVKRRDWHRMAPAMTAGITPDTRPTAPSPLGMERPVGMVASKSVLPPSVALHDQARGSILAVGLSRTACHLRVSDRRCIMSFAAFRKNIAKYYHGSRISFHLTL